MTLRYRLLGKPGTLNEATDLLVSRGARSVLMELRELYTNPEAMSTAPVCEYRVITPTNKFQFRYIFLGKNNLLQQVFGRLPVIGDASLMNYKSTEEAYKELWNQREELVSKGIDALLVKLTFDLEL